MSKMPSTTTQQKPKEEPKPEAKIEPIQQEPKTHSMNGIELPFIQAEGYASREHMLRLTIKEAEAMKAFVIGAQIRGLELPDGKPVRGVPDLMRYIMYRGGMIDAVK